MRQHVPIFSEKVFALFYFLGFSLSFFLVRIFSNAAIDINLSQAVSTRSLVHMQDTAVLNYSLSIGYSLCIFGDTLLLFFFRLLLTVPDNVNIAPAAKPEISPPICAALSIFPASPIIKL